MCNKVKFINEDYALQYLDKLKNTSKRKVIPQRVYLCEECLNWHLTSSNTLLTLSEHLEIVQKYRNLIDNLTKQNTNLQNKNKGLSDEIKHLKEVEESDKLFIKCMIQD
jgi:hypothetical protein